MNNKTLHNNHNKYMNNNINRNYKANQMKL